VSCLKQDFSLNECLKQGFSLKLLIEGVFDQYFAEFGAIKSIRKIGWGFPTTHTVYFLIIICFVVRFLIVFRVFDIFHVFDHFHVFALRLHEKRFIFLRLREKELAVKEIDLIK